jgi:hypothetical protein
VSIHGSESQSEKPAQASPIATTRSNFRCKRRRGRGALAAFARAL